MLYKIKLLLLFSKVSLMLSEGSNHAGVPIPKHAGFALTLTLTLPNLE